MCLTAQIASRLRVETVTEEKEKKQEITKDVYAEMYESEWLASKEYLVQIGYAQTR